MNIDDILHKEGIKTNLKSLNKKRMLQDIANLASNLVGVSSMDIARALQQRELLGPTGIGNGVAIPHIKIRGLKKIYGLFFTLENPIDFESVDKQPVDLIFSLLAPEDENGTEHLKALAMVSRIFSNKETRSKLRLAQDVETVFAILTNNRDSKAA